jgi:2-hydroxycyclohexanecarboxyl-CoA dehydrogenase
MNLIDKKAVVTGSGQGIGKAVALKLAEEGADVGVVDINIQTAGETAAEIKKLNRHSIALQADVTDFEQVKGMVEKVIKDLGRVDILVNNVGWDIIQPFIENTVEYWDKVIAINFKGALYCTRVVLDDMVKRGNGKIINISSDAGRVGSLGETCYAGAKGGVIAFTKSLAREVARYKINVNCVCPGPTDTPLFRGQPEKVRESLERAIPFRRVAKPEDIAGAVSFFASKESDYITGQVISVSGGLTMAG